MSHLIIIVALDQRVLYEYLCWGFSTTRGVQVILDRRRGQRRERARPPREPERRGSDRRRRGAGPAEIRARGFAIASSTVVYVRPLLAERPPGEWSVSHEAEPAPAPRPSAPSVAIVRRGQNKVFSSLEQLFKERGLFRPAWDRRLGERRTRERPVPVERRQGEQRRVPPETWTTLGFVVVAQDGGGLLGPRAPAPPEDHRPAAPPAPPRTDQVPEAADAFPLDLQVEGTAANTVVLVSRGDLERSYQCQPILDATFSEAWRCGFCGTGLIIPPEGRLVPRLGSACPVCQAVVVKVSQPWWRRLARALRLVSRALRRRSEPDEDSGSF